MIEITIGFKKQSDIFEKNINICYYVFVKETCIK